MTKQFTLIGQFHLFCLLMIFMSFINVTFGKNEENFLSNSEDDDSSEEQRRAYELKKLRHFLLTANAQQRAAKREQQDFYKRELIKEYLRSIEDPDSSRLEEVKKRFCASLDEFYATQAACLG